MRPTDPPNRRIALRLRVTLSALLAIFALLPGAGPAGEPEADSGRWAADWEEAALRARTEKKLVLVLVELYGGIDLEPQLPHLFTDPDLADLLETRFVGLQWRRGMKAPFQNPRVYGMGPSTFGGAILFATPEGRIVGQLASSSAIAVDEYARALLARCPDFPGTPVASELDDLSRAAAHLKRGEIVLAAPLLRKGDSLWARCLRASLEKRLRHGEAAIADLEAARDDAIGDQLTDLILEEGIVRVRMGQADQAEQIFAALLNEHPNSAGAPAALYWMARIRLRGYVPAGKATLERLVKEHPESPWAEHAAMMLRVGALERYSVARLEWPDARMMEVVRDPKPEPFPAGRVAEAEEGGIAALLGAQLADGSWITPYQLASREPAFRIAATSICGRSLLPHRARPGVKSAVERALGSILGAIEDGTVADEPPIVGFDYSNWGRIFALRFVAACRQAGIGEKERTLAAARDLVEALEERQTPGGGWSYYGDQEASFVTAAAAIALVDAKESGVEVPETLLRRTMKCLRAFGKGETGFRYMRGSAKPDTESALRGPACALALFRGGAGSAEEMAAALDRVAERRAEVRRERGKALCHTAPDGVASYYLLYGYAFAGEALEALPEEERTGRREAIVEEVLSMRLEDGCFLDFPAIGRFTGTGMALLALHGTRK